MVCDNWQHLSSPFHHSCFISNLPVFFGVFLGPIFAILLINMVMFVLVARVLIKHSLKKSAENEQRSQQKSAENEQRSSADEQRSQHRIIVRTLLSVSCVMFLFGPSWIFAAFTVKEAAFAFQILFIIFNSTQGFFIFFFICVLSREIRQEWLNILTCGHTGRCKLAFSRAGHSIPNNHSITRSTALTSRGNRTTKRAMHKVDMENSKAPIVEMKPFEEVASHTPKLLEIESTFVEEENEMESEDPPQINARSGGAAAAPLKSAKRYMFEGVGTTIANVFVEEDDVMDSEVPPQVLVRGRTAPLPIKIPNEGIISIQTANISIKV